MKIRAAIGVGCNQNTECSCAKVCGTSTCSVRPVQCAKATAKLIRAGILISSSFWDTGVAPVAEGSCPICGRKLDEAASCNERKCRPKRPAKKGTCPKTETDTE